MSRSQAELVNEALHHLTVALEYSKLDLASPVVIDAISLRLATAIDSLNRLPTEVLDVTFGRDWPLMRGMRNRIVHGYTSVDSSTIRATVTEEIPLLVELLSSMQ